MLRRNKIGTKAADLWACKCFSILITRGYRGILSNGWPTCSSGIYLRINS